MLSLQGEECACVVCAQREVEELNSASKRPILTTNAKTSTRKQFRTQPAQQAVVGEDCSDGYETGCLEARERECRADRGACFSFLKPSSLPSRAQKSAFGELHVCHC